MFLAGRGAGKTRSGSEWIRENVRQGVKRIGLIAPTAGDSRDVMVEGSSGILEVCWEYDRDIKGNPLGKPLYEPSKRRLTWANGAMATTFSAEEPERLRGPQHELLWCDELAAWQYAQDCWDMAMFGLRIGAHPRAMVTTTPKPIPVVRELMRSPNCIVTRATTYANLPNLAPSFVNALMQRYEGTRIGRQELMGEVVDESEKALWNRDMIAAAQWPFGKPLPDMRRIVVAIDPAITENPTSNLTGIVVAGRGRDNRGYVLDDLSGRYSPDAWARRAVDAFDEYKADRIVAEGNQGGDLVRHTISTVRKNLPITIVHASTSKQARAEPVSALYEQKKVSHARSFPELEDQLCTWEPLSGDESPDRLDALVWGLTDLFIRGNEPLKMVPAYVAGPKPRAVVRQCADAAVRGHAHRPPRIDGGGGRGS
jgi:phage terminase large subunit-like protein